MTFKTPFHLQRLRLRDDGHLIDAAMTCRTSDALVHVDRMIEISKIREVMNANPLQGLSVFETVAHRFEIRTVRPNLLVAIHANRGRRYSCRSRGLHGRVTIAAINAVIADVMFVAELDWLLALDILAGVPARPSDFCGDPQCGQQDKNRAVNRGSRKIVGAVTKNLGHCRRYSLYRLTGGPVRQSCKQAGASSLTLLRKPN